MCQIFHQTDRDDGLAAIPSSRIRMRSEHEGPATSITLGGAQRRRRANLARPDDLFTRVYEIDQGVPDYH